MNMRISRHLSLPALLIFLALLWPSTGSSQAGFEQLTWDPDLGYTSRAIANVALLPESDREALSMLNNARRLEERGRHGSAIRGYTRVTRRHPSTVFAPEAFLRIAQIQKQRGRIDKAFEAYDQLVRRYPTYGSFDRFLGEQFTIARELIEGRRLPIFGVFPGLPNRDRGIVFFERVIANAPFNDLAPLALMHIATGHARKRNPEQAIDALDRIINFYPNHLLAEDAYLKLAEAHASLVDGPYWDQGSTREAIAFFEDFLILFPQSENVGRAETGLAEMQELLAQSKLKIADFYYLRRRNYRAALVFYNEAITTAPTSATAAIARERITRVESLMEVEGPFGRRSRFLGIF